jgi:predicted nucleic acid-binding protein
MRETASSCGRWLANFSPRLANLTSRDSPRRTLGIASGEFRDLLPLVFPTDGNLDRAKELHLRRGASLWDALIIAACVEAGVDTLYSEDLPGFDDFEGVRVVNPFK